MATRIRRATSPNGTICAGACKRSSSSSVVASNMERTRAPRRKRAWSAADRRRPRVRMFAVILLVGLALLPGAASADNSVTVKGSDTMVILGQKWAEVYMQKNPGTKVLVTGGGSAT